MNPDGTPPDLTETKRLVVDYRNLNSQLPLVDIVGKPKSKKTIAITETAKIEDLLTKVRGAKVFSAIDIRSGYSHISISPETRHKTAFTTIYGKFHYNRCSFGLAEAPSYFLSLMYEIFFDFMDEFLIFYMDDLLLFSRDESQHLQHLQLVFEHLREAGLKIKPSK